VGEDGAALSWQTRRSGAQGQEQSCLWRRFFGSSAPAAPGDLPPAFGNWSSAYTRFRDWVKGDVWKRLFDAVSEEPDMEYAMVDATIVKVHRHGQGAKRGTQS